MYIYPRMYTCICMCVKPICNACPNSHLPTESYLSHLLAERHTLTQQWCCSFKHNDSLRMYYIFFESRKCPLCRMLT